MSNKRNNSSVQPVKRKIIVESLEPRTLFSADVVSASLALDLVADDSLDQTNWLADTGQSEFSVSNDKGDSYAHDRFAGVLYDRESIHNSRELIGFEEHISEEIAELTPDFEQPRQLIVIDERVDDSEALLQDVYDNAQSSTDFDVLRLDEDTDGIEAITAALIAQNDQPYDAVHIITHGDDAELQLGSTQLTGENLQQFQSELSSWSAGLALDADVLLYGCDVAQTEHGEQFVNQISQWTGADVASSDDTTGYADLGGNWEFEYKVGEIDTDIVFSRTIQSTYSGVFESGDDYALWVTTRPDVSNSTAPGLSDWTDQDVIQIDGLTLETGDGSTGTTDGTFSEAIDFDTIAASTADLDALHVVSAPITVQGVALQEGDLLFSGNTNTPVSSTNSLTGVNPHNVFVFRPDVADDYSSGTFELLINQTALGLADAVNGFSLVETDTIVGDQALSRGDFIYSARDTDIHWFDSSTGTSSVLISGADIGLNELFRGVELIESSTDIGGITVDSGSLLIAIDAPSPIGDNALTGNNHDVILLEVNTTGAGTTSAIASAVFDGSDLGLSSSERFDGISLKSTVAVNDAPELENFGPFVNYTVGGGPIVLDTDVTVVDTELTTADNFGGAQLQIMRLGGANAVDQFGTTGLLDPLLEGADVVYDGVIVGTADIDSGGEVLITFNNSASNADVNGVLQSITYQNTINSASDSLELEWLFDDGNISAQGNGGAQTTSGILSVEFIEAPVVVVNQLNIDEHSANGTSAGLVTPDDAVGIAALLAADTSLVYDEFTGKFYRHVATPERFSTALTDATTTTLNGASGQLLTIRSAYENTLALGIADGSQVWLGATDETTSGEWHWLDGTTDADPFWSGEEGGSAVAGSYHNWNALEPNNSQIPSSEDYGALNTGGEWFDWSDESNHRLDYIIEWDAADVLANRTFALTDDANGRFFIDSVTGEITVADGTQLDFETDITHDVTVEVDYGVEVATEVVPINVNNLNDPPEFINLGPAVDFTPDDGPVVLDPDATVVDLQLTAADNFDGAQLQILRQGGANSFDEFSATGLLNPLVEGNDVTYDGKIVGTADIASGGELLIKFNSDADNADVNGVMQSIAYENTNSSPDNFVDLDWTFDDGNVIDQGPGGAQSTTETLRVRIFASFDVDENSANGTSIGLVPGDDPQAIINALAAANPDLIYDKTTGKFYKLSATEEKFSVALNNATSNTLNGVNGQLLTVRSDYENTLALTITGGERVWLGATDADSEGEWHWLDGDVETEQFWSGNENGSVVAGSYNNWDSDEPNASFNEDVAAIETDGLWFDWSESNNHRTYYITEWNAAEVAANIAFTLSDDANGRFTIDPDTGEISVADGTQLDFETDVEHDITVDIDYGAYTSSEVFTIDVNNLNDPPEFVDFGPAVDFIPDDGPVVLDADITVVDTELTPIDNFNGAQLQILRQGGASTFDQFSATGLLDPLVEGTDVTYAGNIVGTANIASGGELLITFNGNATNDDVNGVMQSIAYENTNTAPPGNVNLEWTLDDGSVTDQGSGGSQSTTGTLSVRIIPDFNIDENSVNGTSVGTVPLGAEAGTITDVQSILDSDSSLVHDPVTGKFYKAVQANLIWDDANTAAGNTLLNGATGQLVTIRSPAENTTVQNLASSLPNPGDVWIGASDQNSEGNWYWYEDGVQDNNELFYVGTASGSAEPGYYTNWKNTDGVNEPTSGTGEDFARLTEDTGEWRDTGAGTNSYVVEWDVEEVLANPVFTLSDDANGRFAIDSNTGEITVADGTQLDFETDMSHDVTVEVDYGSSVTSEMFTIDVNDINDAPVLDTTATLTLPAIAEDDLDPAGDTVANILASDGLNSVTDDDSGAVEGIAVYTVDDANGVWEYSLDGSSWTAIGAVDTTSALLLDPTAKMRFIPDADFSGTAGFFFHAWDQTQGSSGQLFDIMDSGGSTASAALPAMKSRLTSRQLMIHLLQLMTPTTQPMRTPHSV